MENEILSLLLAAFFSSVKVWCILMPTCGVKKKVFGNSDWKYKKWRKENKKYASKSRLPYVTYSMRNTCVL